MFPLHPSLTSNGRTADTTREKAECLNSVFASKSSFKNPSLSLPTLPSRTQLSLDSVSFSPERWTACCQTSTQILQPVQTASAHVSEKPAPLLLLTLSLFHSPSHLFKVICHLLENQQTLLPCIKNGANTDPCNYRPIISKVMESIIASDIKSFLFSNGLISDHQFGFRPGHSR